MIESLQLKQYKGFNDTTVEFSNITCIVGENSTGKSTIIEAIQDLLTNENGIPPNCCKVGIHNIAATSLLLTLQDGKKRFKDIGKVEFEKDDKSCIDCIRSISPIGISYALTGSNIVASDLSIKDHAINDIAWRNILSDCDFTSNTAIRAITSNSSAMRFNKQYLFETSQKFTNTFNNMLRDSNREYEFEVFFEVNGSDLVVQLLISYKMRNEELNKTPQVDLNCESLGFRSLITLCSYFFNDQDRTERIFVMDEPFTNIHPKAQLDVSRMLQSLSQKFQIIYATHCPHLLPERDNVICTFTKAAGDLSVCKFEEYPLNLFYDFSPFVLDMVGEVEQSDFAINVCVEGITDEKIYRSFFEIKGISDSIGISNMGGTGNYIGNMKAFATIDKPSLFILDPKENVKKLNAMKKLEEEYDNLFLLQLPIIEGNQVEKGIEHLIPNHIIERAYKELENVVQILIEQYHGEEPIEKYIVKKKTDLAEFFVNEAKDDDYQFFSPIIEKIDEIEQFLRQK